MEEFLKTAVMIFYVIGIYTCLIILHDYILRHIYCIFKQKKGNKKKCYFWNCPKFKDCPFNDTK